MAPGDAQSLAKLVVRLSGNRQGDVGSKGVPLVEPSMKKIL